MRPYQKTIIIGICAIIALSSLIIMNAVGKMNPIQPTDQNSIRYFLIYNETTFDFNSTLLVPSSQDGSARYITGIWVSSVSYDNELFLDIHKDNSTRRIISIELGCIDNAENNFWSSHGGAPIVLSPGESLWKSWGRPLPWTTYRITITGYDK